jgi:hypothetical protein
MRNRFLLFITAILIISSCARPYRKLYMSAIPFKENREENKISYSVRQGLMYNTRNIFYARKEQKKDVSLMAFKIINKSELPININDLQFSCGATVTILPILKEDYYNAVKQKAALYWLYSAGFIVYPKPAVYKNASDEQINKPDNPKKFIKNGKQFIPIPFGVVMAAANYGLAYRANKKLKTDLENLDLTNKIIQPGDSIFGILPFKSVANCGDIFITVKE